MPLLRTSAKILEDFLKEARRGDTIAGAIIF
jgi:hypothetical protein